jgi:hypothetical protein
MEKTAILLLCLCTWGAAEDLRAKLTYYVKHQPHLHAQLEATFHEVSNPRHQNYGKHLSFEEVVRHQIPTNEHIALVEAHLASIGAVEIDRTVAGDKVSYS